jgi:UDP-N-acetylmuramate dehydrogenase
VSQTVTGLRAVDRASRRVVTLAASECRFGYRDSLFRSVEPDRFLVLDVTYRLRSGGVPAVRYAELGRHLEGRGLSAPSLAQVRESVIEIRRAKSMVLDPGDPNRRSCGSFFVNPVLAAADAGACRRAGRRRRHAALAGAGRTREALRGLAHRARGFPPGERAGAVGLSTRHNPRHRLPRLRARAGDVAGFRATRARRVAERFGVRLAPEPVFWGPVSLDAPA